MGQMFMLGGAAQHRERCAADLARRLNAEEAEAAGADLRPGTRHPRAWDGAPALYDLAAAEQFRLLTALGLREYHRVLEVGCGGLRLGRLLIPYLLPERYFGAEPEREILEAGCRMHFGAGLESSQVIAAKRPRFSHEAAFEFGFTGGPVDFVIVGSAAAHAGPALLQALLAEVRDVMAADARAIVTYAGCAELAESNRREGWFHPAIVTYTESDFAAFCRGAALAAVFPEGRWAGPVAGPAGEADRTAILARASDTGSAATPR